MLLWGRVDETTVCPMLLSFLFVRPALHTHKHTISTVDDRAPSSVFTGPAQDCLECKVCKVKFDPSVPHIPQVNCELYSGLTYVKDKIKITGNCILTKKSNVVTFYYVNTDIEKYHTAVSCVKIYLDRFGSQYDNRKHLSHQESNTL